MILGVWNYPGDTYQSHFYPDDGNGMHYSLCGGWISLNMARVDDRIDEILYPDRCQRCHTILMKEIKRQDNKHKKSPPLG